MGKTKLVINNNGSIKIDGEFEIVAADGTVYGLEGRTTLGLCRHDLNSYLNHHGEFQPLWVYQLSQRYK